ncbi:MAG: thermonuclease family protein [Aquimonas sp.]|nr:thermonuclease family protein [Aquimonas sp.]
MLGITKVLFRTALAGAVILPSAAGLMIAGPQRIGDWLGVGVDAFKDMLVLPEPRLGDGRQIIEGLAEVINGDTLTIGGQLVQLAGIDAPARLDQCLSQDMSRCGLAARNALKAVVGERAIRCVAEDTNALGALATCYLGTTELNRLMVRHGYAKAYRAYSDTYVDEQLVAEAAGQGMWQR